MRLQLTAVLAVTSLLLGSVLALARQQAEPERSPPFEDGRYRNEGFNKSTLDLLRYYATREPGIWRRQLNLPPGPQPAALIGKAALRVTVVNHATVLVQFDGLNLLTDPIWSDRASPVQWAGPKRFVPPGLRFEDLPRIDAVLISHNHYDHLDLPTLQRLEKAFSPQFIVGEREGALLRDAGLKNVVELGWGQPARLANGSQVFGTAARHWTGRSPMGRNRSLWMSYVFTTSAGPVYFAGDTGYGPQFKAARAHHGQMRLALLPIGAYKPRWLTEFQHMDPCQAVQAHQDLGAAQSVAIHYGTFELADDGQHEPKEELLRCLKSHNLDAQRFTAPSFGTGYDVAPLTAPDPGPT